MKPTNTLQAQIIYAKEKQIIKQKSDFDEQKVII